MSLMIQKMGVKISSIPSARLAILLSLAVSVRGLMDLRLLD
ncbi:hypothetical protein [Acinetobacter variabilis]|nr:hypothetical protein [Acinetobacter variabilis]